MYKQKLRILSRLLGLTLTACLVGGLLAPAAYAAEGGEQVEIKSLRATSMVRKDGKQEVEATLNNGGAAFDAYAKVTVGEESPYMAELGEVKAGQQTVIIPVTDTHDMLEPGETTTLTVELYNNGRGSGRALGSYTDDQWARTRHWEIYLSQEMHTDLGYTQYQENLKDTFSGYLDTVKEYMENSDNRETDLQKYKYAIESGFMLGEGYMTRRTADDMQWIIDRIKEGRMEIGAGQFNYTIENFSTEEAARATYYTNRHLADMLGVEISQTQRMFDNPAFSKGYVDFAVSAGIKYGFHSMNPDRSPYHQKRQYDLFYMQGNDPNNKLLIFNGKAYSENYGFGGSHFSPEGSVDAANTAVLNLFRELEARTGRTAYPYDKFPMALVPYGDNQRPMEDQIIVANGLNKKWDEEGYAYPRIKTAFPDEFFQDVEAEYGDMIPVETGTEENWWNDGWGTTAYESGTNKLAGALIPVAETAASFASLFAGSAYPYNDIYDAVERNLTYDEHTWGAAGYDDNNADYHNQFEWKRSNAFAAKNLAEKVLSGSLDSLASTVPTAGKAIYVYNPLNWERDDVVTVTDLTGFPEHFAIKDGDTSIPYTVEDGKLTFVAPAIPAMGYKTFAVEEITAAPSFESKVTAGEDYIENDYYKVTFAADGTISSILDKQNGNRELVDGASEAKFNQYQYYDDHGIPFANQGADFGEDKWTLYTPDAAAGKLELTETAVGATATLDTSTFRTDGIVQKVTLYNDMPRIDIENTVVKTSLPSVQDKEEAFYTFPFKAEDGYEIRYDLPAGNVAEGEQVYGTSTDWYTAGKWVNVQDTDGYNMTLALPDTSLLQFGERRTGNWSFDYKSENPYIYSYVMNNMWQTNFQGDQPGAVTFTYAISTNKGEGMEDTARFGWEVSYPLQATVIAGAQAGSAAASDSYLDIDNENVQLTTMKTAEANDEGMILRFHEIGGSETGKVTVTLPFQVESVTETNVIEEDMEQVAGAGNTFTFEMTPYDIKTFRIRFGDAPGKVESLTAVTTGESTLQNLSTSATATASSEFSAEYAASNALELSNGKEWASSNQTTATIRLAWDSEVQIGSFALADRTNGVDNVQSATVTFSDGSKVEVTDIDPAGKVQMVTLDETKTVNWVEVEIRCDRSSNIGLSGLEFYAPGGEAAATEGTQLTWEPVEGALYYEIFRSADPNFTAGSGNYLASSQRTQYFDTQVPGGLSQPYYYQVRAVGAGAKGAASDAVQQVVEGQGEIEIPDLPENPEEPEMVIITPVSVQTGNSYNNKSADVAINGSGLTGEGLDAVHDNQAQGDSMWYTNGNPGDTAWIQINFNKAYPLDEMYIWNMNQQNSSDRGLKNIKIQYSPDGVVWYDLQPEDGMTFAEEGAEGYPFQLARASGESGQAATNLNDGNNTPIRFGGALAKHVKITAHPENGVGSWGGEYFGLSEVRFTTTSSAFTPFENGILNPVSAQAGSWYANQRPTLTINGSGLTGEGLDAVHDNHGNAHTMWHTEANPGENAWVQINFDRAYPLDELYIWNMNQSNNIGRGLKNVKIQYSPDGVAWYDLQPEAGMTFAEESPEGYPFQLAQGSGQPDMPATNLNDGNNTPIRFGGVLAKHVKITAHPENGVGSWGAEYFGLSEVRFTVKTSEGAGLTVQNEAPEAPVINATPRLGTRVDLDWAPVYDDVKLDHYEIYRDGALIGKTLDAYLCTYRDKTAQPNTTYTYTVKAVDTAGNGTMSAPVSVKTMDSLAATLSDLTVSMGTLTPGFTSDNRFYSLNLGDNFGRFDGVTVTATATDADATIYVNGVETASGAESALVPLAEPGDQVVIRVVEGESSKVYTLTAGTDAPILTAVDATAGSQFDNQKPTLIIDGNGLTGEGLDAVHDNNGNAFSMWHTNANPGGDAWVQIDLGQAYPLDEMWVWNMNQQNNIGRGLKNVKIEYSTDGNTWQALQPEAGMTFADSPAGYPFQFAQGTGENGMPATNLNDGRNTPVRFGGEQARYVKIIAHPEAGTGSWGDVYYGLSEVRFTTKLELRDIVEAESIKVSAENGKNEITTPGGSLQMVANILPENATKQRVDWSVESDRDNVAVISADGLLVAHRNGTVEVVATAVDGSGVTGRTAVKVSGQPEVIEGVTARAGSVYDQFNTPEGVVDGEGMSGIGSVFDLHDNNGNGVSMWHTTASPGINAWIEFDLGKVRSVAEMYIWNMNQKNNTDRGLKHVKIEYRSTENDDWKALKGDGEGEYDFTLAKGTGENGMAATNLIGGKPVELNLETRFVRITAAPTAGEGNYGSNYYGLSEVRFTAGGQSQPNRTLEEAKAAAETALADLQVSNATTEKDILEAVTAAVDNPAVTVSVSESLALTPATDEAAGSITGQISLSYDGEEALVEVDLTIPALGEQIVPGDLDKDGEVTIADVMEACKVMARESAGTDPTDDEIARGDLDGDGEITIADVMEICKILARQG